MRLLPFTILSQLPSTITSRFGRQQAAAPHTSRPPADSLTISTPHLNQLDADRFDKPAQDAAAVRRITGQSTQELQKAR